MEEIKKADSLDSKFTVFKLSLKKIRQMGLWDRIFPDLSELWFRTISAQLCDDLFFECIDDLRIEEFVECGANDAYASKHLSIKGVSSIAIEPNPITFKSLTNSPNHYKSLNIGLGEQQGNLDFHVPKGSKYAVDATFKKRLDIEYDTINVPVETLDNVVKSEGLGSRKGALWVDVEGFQKEVLHGARNYLKNPNLLLLKIEVETKIFFQGQILSEDVNEILEEHGFEPIFCDFEFSEQFNVIYIRKSYVDSVADKIEKYWFLLRQKNISLLILSKMLLSPNILKSTVLANGKRIVITLFGPKIGNKIVSILRSKNSQKSIK